MRAYLKNYRQSPRKVRLVGDLIKGVSVSRARLLLEHTPKRATVQLRKLLDSAVANAITNHKMDEHSLIVATIRVDKGITIKRYRPRAHGRASRIRKFTSNIILELKEKVGTTKTKAPKEPKATMKKEKKEPKAKSTKTVAKKPKKTTTKTAAIKKKTKPKAKSKK